MSTFILSLHQTVCIAHHPMMSLITTYPDADAGYGRYNNYLYCEQKGMEKYMKFTMFKKETTDKKYRENEFRAVNFKI